MKISAKINLNRGLFKFLAIEFSGDRISSDRISSDRSRRQVILN
ncbi:MAG TPA: hypothetical protein V6C65_12775 [Allocoleopsis sp.]